MADKLISELSAAATLDGTELLAGDQSGSDVKVTTQAIADLASGGAIVALIQTGILGFTRTDQTAPIALGSIDTVSPPVMAVNVTGAPILSGMGGNIISLPQILFPNFTTPVTIDLNFGYLVTNPTGTEIAQGGGRLAQFPAGPVAADTLQCDFTGGFAPTFTGTDLSAVGGSIVTAAGGVFSSSVTFAIAPD